jgi:hypothetical protein
MRDKLALAATILYYVFWPFLKLFHAITFILAPFWTIARFVILPITYLAHTLFSIASLPFRVQLLDRIEVSPFQHWIAAIFQKQETPIMQSGYYAKRRALPRLSTYTSELPP